MSPEERITIELNPSERRLYDRLRREGERVPGTMGEYLQVPAGLDPRFKSLAERITAGANNDYDRALRLEAYLRENYGYTLDIGQKPGSQYIPFCCADSTVQFLPLRCQ